MKTHLKLKLLAVALVFPLLVSQQAFAQNATGTLLQTGTGLANFSIALNAPFSLDLNITTTFSSIGATYFFQSNDALSPFFYVNGRITTGTPYADNTTPDGTAFADPAGRLNPVNDFDLGATCNGCFPNGIAPGTYFMGTLSFSTTGLAAGTYHIFLDSRAIVADSNFADHSLVANQVTITIVPEPATTGLAVLGGVILLAFVWRARRVMA